MPATQEHSEFTIDELVEFVRFTNLFRSVERLIWFRGVEGRERDGEHSFQLALVGWYLNERMKLKLDVTRIIMYALTHDLLEAYAGDACWSPSAGYSTEPMHSKKDREYAALLRIKEEWGERFPTLLDGIEAYERQENEESRFVYALDKLITELNIVEDEPGRTNLPLGVTREMTFEYKLPKMAKHPVIAELYRRLIPLLDKDPRYYATPA